MKNIVTTGLITSLIIVAGAANAGHGNKWRSQNQSVYYDRAKVIQVTPIYETVRVSTPHRECYSQEVRRDRHDHGNKAASTVIGGLIGGAVGHRVGKHRKGATVAGAIIGAAIGNNVGRSRGHSYQEVSYEDVCETQQRYHQEQRIDGYNVSYRYKGEIFNTRMDEHPGKRIKLKIHVSPVVD